MRLIPLHQLEDVTGGAVKFADTIGGSIAVQALAPGGELSQSAFRHFVGQGMSQPAALALTVERRGLALQEARQFLKGLWKRD